MNIEQIQIMQGLIMKRNSLKWLSKKENLKTIDIRIYSDDHSDSKELALPIDSYICEAIDKNIKSIFEEAIRIVDEKINDLKPKCIEQFYALISKN